MDNNDTKYNRALV